MEKRWMEDEQEDVLSYLHWNTTSNSAPNDTERFHVQKVLQRIPSAEGQHCQLFLKPTAASEVLQSKVWHELLKEDLQ